ncbi:DUF6197 family protein [Streptomyces sp. 900105755]
MPSTITTPPAVFTDETLSRAAEQASAGYRPVWTGPSGEEISGDAVARHLEAAITLLDKDGWVRVYDSGKAWSTNSQVPAEDDNATVKAMLKSLLCLFRDEIGTNPARTMSTALRHVGESAHGDTDTAAVASSVLDLVVRAHTGSADARAMSWSERITRTHADITALLTAGARFARAYGPDGHSTQAA